MRAWQIQQYGEPETALCLAETPLPVPQPGELRVRVEAAALGLPDVFMSRGSYVFKPELPATPGQEVAGVVTAVGEGSTVPVGSRVMGVTVFFRGHGGFAEEALVLEASSYPVPDGMDAVDAAAFVIPYHTAYLALLTRARIQQGETLVVLGGAGGSGAAAIQLGRALGARVIAVAGGEEKVAGCRRFGAQRVIDHQREDLAEVVRGETEGRGADVIFDPVGGEAFEAGIDCIASEGRLLAIGYASGRWSDASTQVLVGKNASLLGVFVGAYAKPFLGEVHDELLAMWRAREIASLVSRTVCFEEIPPALAELAERRAVGKTVARMAAGPS